MTKLMVLGVALATAIVLTTVVSATDHSAIIIFTENHNPNGVAQAECVGIVGTETIPSTLGEKITWMVQNDATNPCRSIDMTKIELRFKTNVMGKAAMKKLPSDSTGKIEGNVSSDKKEAPKDSHHK
jgi:hypothetical protein